ncbi:hypothetical protein QEL87_002693 [Pseudomonas putida]|nr:hypothetical protein [Pseudomonas putida]
MKDNSQAPSSSAGKPKNSSEGSVNELDKATLGSGIATHEAVDGQGAEPAAAKPKPGAFVLDLDNVTGEAEPAPQGQKEAARTLAIARDILDSPTLKQARATLDAMKNPPWKETISALPLMKVPSWKHTMASVQAMDSASLRQARAAVESMNNSPLRLSLAAVESMNSSSLQQARAAVEAFNSSSLKPTLAAVEPMNSSSLQQAMAAVKSMNLPSIKLAMAAVDSINSSSLKQAVAAIESIKNPPWKQTMAAVNAMDNASWRATAAALNALNNSSLRSARAALDSLNLAYWRSAFAGLDSLSNSSALRIAAATVTSWGELKSPLLGYLASEGAPDLALLLREAVFDDPLNLIESGGFEELEAAAVDGQIVERLESGDGVEQLSAAYRARLIAYLVVLINVTSALVDVIGVWQAYDFVQEKLFGAKAPTEVTETLAKIPADKLSLLKGLRVLNGDKVNLRTEPSDQSEIKALPQKGALLEVLEDGEVWIRVSVDIAGETLEGWVARRYTIPIRLPAKK